MPDDGTFNTDRASARRVTASRADKMCPLWSSEAPGELRVNRYTTLTNRQFFVCLEAPPPPSPAMGVRRR